MCTSFVSVSAVTCTSFVCVSFHCSSDFYLGTVPFQADPRASTLYVEISSASGEEIGSFTVDIKNRPFSKPEHVANALSKDINRKAEGLYNAWASKTASKRRTSMPVIRCGYERGRTKLFWFSIEKKSTGAEDVHLLLGRDHPTCILPKLGFLTDKDTGTYFRDPEMVF